ncbi:SDR family oxidoreductase [Nocardioides albidus]|uniref:SDR family oxidoreductase n=1 Tax=Nocardioides albidus TaxID=1517589 RepID=A0A5C4VKT6_9ACTN|nr:SDR family oxidoreductase [Nocardioides albidus]TNM36450.1 SDR family oxidoreductase [Nocardioides albidus]
MPKPAHPARRPAVVAGASSGIGAQTAKALAAAGFPVALGARRVERCEELATAIREDGGEAFVHALDVASTESVERFAGAVAKELGDVEVVVCNAGRLAPGSLLDATTEQLVAEFDVNVLGAHRLLRAFGAGMVERQRGDLVFVSSDTALRARPFMRGYSATKSGLEGLVEALRMELEGSGVRASVVRPGPTWSEMGSDWDAEAGAKVLTEWVRWGHARHSHFLEATAIADAIVTVVCAPRGVHISPVDVNPEAPVEKP